MRFSPLALSRVVSVLLVEVGLLQLKLAPRIF